MLNRSSLVFVFNKCHGAASVIFQHKKIYIDSRTIESPLAVSFTDALVAPAGPFVT